MSDESTFLAALKANPADDTTRLVYADWLDENDEPEEAEYLRLVCVLAGLPESELLESPTADKLLAQSQKVLPWWQADAGARFELALLEFHPADDLSLVFALERLLHLEDRFQIQTLVSAVPIALRSPLSFAAAAELNSKWLRFEGWYRSRPRVVVRPVPYPFFSECGLFDLVLQKLPWDFWPNWPAVYKHPVSELLDLPTRDAANHVRKLPAVVYRALQQADVEPALARIRRAFNQSNHELLAPDALVVVPHTSAVKT
jgi:uncharacterized protein (TIGR02996 family)